MTPNNPPSQADARDLLQSALHDTDTCAMPMHGVTWVEHSAALRAIEAAIITTEARVRAEVVEECLAACAEVAFQQDCDHGAANTGGAEACIEALRNLPTDPQPTDGWQPIETAPKEGPVLLWRHELGEIIIAENRMNDGTWWVGDWEYPVAATHWRPLPEPPVATQPTGDA